VQFCPVLPRHRQGAHALPALGVVLCLAFFAAACGPSDDKGGKDNGSDPVPLRGGERLTWDQSADSVPSLRSHTYRLYVDGNRTTFTDVRCNETRNSGGYECSGLLPGMAAGRHSLELTSMVSGVESPHSAPIIVTLATSTTIVTAMAPAVSPTALAAANAVTWACVVTSSSGKCFDGRVIANGLDSPSALSPTSDGRLFFIEGNSRVRAIDGDVLVPEPVLELPNPDARFVGLAVDQEFERTRSMFVAWTELNRDGMSSLNVTRYRELQNRLAEGATIISGLAIPPDAVAPLTLDREGLLYVGLPGAVLRFTRDGMVPSSNPRASSIIAETRAAPSALAVDSSGQRVWFAGRESGHLVVASFALPPREDVAWLAQVTSASASELPAVVSANPTLVLATSDQNGKALLTAGGRVFNGRLTTVGRFAEVEELQLQDGERAFAAAGRAGFWYVVAGRDEASLELRLIRRE
jgi:hypothetical protein